MRKRCATSGVGHEAHASWLGLQGVCEVSAQSAENLVKLIESAVVTSCERKVGAAVLRYGARLDVTQLKSDDIVEIQRWAPVVKRKRGPVRLGRQ